MASFRCPTCGDAILWFGDGDPKVRPCMQCFAGIETISISKPDDFFRGAVATGEVRVVRVPTTVAHTKPDGTVNPDQRAARYHYTAAVNTVEGWRRFQYSDTVLLDDYGKFHLEGSMWRRCMKDSGIALFVDRKRSGAF